jgi:hypothetical protein
MHADQAAYQRRLTGAIVADHRGDLATAGLEGDIGKGPDAAEMLAQSSQARIASADGERLTAFISDTA